MPTLLELATEISRDVLVAVVSGIIVAKAAFKKTNFPISHNLCHFIGCPTLVKVSGITASNNVHLTDDL